MTDARFPESKTDVWQPDSSLVEEVLYNTETQELAVSFNRSDDFYVYPAVPAEVAKAFANASSAGAFYNAYIKAYGPGDVVDAAEIGYACDCTEVAVQNALATANAADDEVRAVETIRYSGLDDVKVGDLVRVLDTPFARETSGVNESIIGLDYPVTQAGPVYVFVKVGSSTLPFRFDEIALVQAAPENVAAPEDDELFELEDDELFELAQNTLDQARGLLDKLAKVVTELTDRH